MLPGRTQGARVISYQPLCLPPLGRLAYFLSNSGSSSANGITRIGICLRYGAISGWSTTIYPSTFQPFTSPIPSHLRMDCKSRFHFILPAVIEIGSDLVLAAGLSHIATLQTFQHNLPLLFWSSLDSGFLDILASWRRPQAYLTSVSSSTGVHYRCTTLGSALAGGKPMTG